MLTTNAQADVGEHGFPITEFQVESSFENLTDQATIVVPRKIRFEGREIIQGESLFKRGDVVQLHAGYDQSQESIFQGYITNLSPSDRLAIKAEDEMWQLKQTSVTFSYKSVTLSKLLADICPIPYEVVGDAQLGRLRASKASVAKVLSQLKSKYGLYSWVRDGKLYAGLATVPSLSSTHILRFHHNIITDDLQYMRSDDVKVKVTAISMSPENQKTEVSVGDSDGDIRTLHFYDLPEIELQAVAERELERFRYEGFRGSLVTFGEPRIRHGDKVELQDTKFPDRNGTYLVRSVLTRLSVSEGFRQEVTLDAKV